jgi:hypothetical protein
MREQCGRSAIRQKMDARDEWPMPSLTRQKASMDAYCAVLVCALSSEKNEQYYYVCVPKYLVPVPGHWESTNNPCAYCQRSCTFLMREIVLPTMAALD